MDRYAHGDGDAFDELFRRYEGRAHSYFLRRTGSQDRAKDLYQELFLRLHRFRHTFQAERRFSSWFFRIASRVAIDELRRASARAAVFLLDGTEGAVPAAAEEDLLNRERVHRVLAQLSHEQAEILIASKVDGVPYGEIAQSVGRSTAAVKQIASRTLRRLRAAHAADA